MNTAVLAKLIQAVFGFQSSCVMKEEENQIIIRVFQVPMDRKKSLEISIYELERILVPDRSVFFSVIAYTPEETERYYPQMAKPKPVPVYEDGLTYRNETPFVSDINDKAARISLAA